MEKPKELGGEKSRKLPYYYVSTSYNKVFFYSSDMSRKGKINKALTAVTVIAVCLHIPPGKWRNREVNSAAFQSMADICLLFKCKNKQAKKPKGKETSWLSGMPARTSWRLVWNASGTIWMPLFLWLSFRPPFFILHFHSSITRPIIGLFFYLFFFIAPGTGKKNVGDSHFIYGSFQHYWLECSQQVDLPMTYYKDSFWIRIFMAMEIFSTNGNLQMWADSLNEEQECLFKVGLRFSDFIYDFHHWHGIYSCFCLSWKNNWNSNLRRLSAHN